MSVAEYRILQIGGSRRAFMSDDGYDDTCPGLPICLVGVYLMFHIHTCNRYIIITLHMCTTFKLREYVT